MSKIEQLRKQLNERKVDGIIIMSPYNRRYMTGFTGTAGVVLITDNRAVFITDFRYTAQAEDQINGFEIIEHTGPIHEEVATQVKKDGLKRIAFEKDHVSYGQFDTWKKALDAELEPVSGLVEKMRLIKSAEEIEVIQQAVDIADAAFTHIQSYIKPGVREIDVSNELEFFMRKKGAASSSFDIIVASGYRSALPHGVASEKIIESGELVTLDFGAYYKGYCSDITRTVAVGEVDEELKKIYHTVLEAQLRGVNHIKSGMTGIEADALTRDHIKAEGYGEYFGHSTGHGMGMEVHEGPGLSFRSEQKLEPGMVVTVEPGIYVAGTGGTRIEDDIVITEDGNRILSKSTKELIVL